MQIFDLAPIRIGKFYQGHKDWYVKFKEESRVNELIELARAIARAKSISPGKQVSESMEEYNQHYFILFVIHNCRLLGQMENHIFLIKIKQVNALSFQNLDTRLQGLFYKIQLLGIPKIP